MNTINTIALKKAFQQYISFPEEDWDKIKQNIGVKHYKKGDVFLRSGQTSNTLGFITRGFFRKYYLKDGDEINFWFYHENQFLVAYQSFLERVPTKFQIEALEDAEILTLPFEAVQNLYTISEAWQKLGRLVCEKMYITHHNRIESLLFKDASVRYYDLVKEHPMLLQRLPQYHLASYLGIKPQSLSRIRKEYKDI
ncbi:Crp/Fnr family transcriptional regulator [Flavivirga eckloniae]|uniref:Crp/Fnr family transcriptional regulator n=1 Tax=Flavivirga eckloniae TaxID=1803846 RepID=UPI001315A591|nr:Crp/Fnr family transcriptional regulator [Flavivirga eckloniae]